MELSLLYLSTRANRSFSERSGGWLSWAPAQWRGYVQSMSLRIAQYVDQFDGNTGFARHVERVVGDGPVLPSDATVVAGHAESGEEVEAGDVGARIHNHLGGQGGVEATRQETYSVSFPGHPGTRARPLTTQDSVMKWDKRVTTGE